MPVQSALQRSATRYPDGGALGDLTWSTVYGRVGGAAAELRRRGVRPGDRIAIDCTDPVDSLLWFVGSDRCGAAALICEPSWTPSERTAVMTAAQPWITVTEPAPAGCMTTMDDDTDDSLFYLGTTSGSTAGPKVYTRSRGSWRATFGPITTVTGLSTADTVLVPGPLSSSMFTFAVLHALHEGARSIVLSGWSAAQVAHHCRTATVLHAVPAMLSALAAIWESDESARAQCRLRVILSCGAKLDPVLEARIHSLVPGCRIVEYYGSSEQSLISVRNEEPVSTVGRPPAIVDIEIRDATGNPVPAGYEGEIWVRSPMLFAGYVDNGSVVPRSGSWLSVGDNGIVHSDGTLSVSGRGTAVVLSGGTNVFAEEVEAVLRTGPGVADAVVVGLPHGRFGAVVTAVIQSAGDAALTRRALRHHAANRLSPGKRPRQWLLVDELPRTATGKIARAAVSEGLRTGTLRAEPLA